MMMMTTRWQGNSRHRHRVLEIKWWFRIREVQSRGIKVSLSEGIVRERRWQGKEASSCWKSWGGGMVELGMIVPLSNGVFMGAGCARPSVSTNDEEENQIN